MSRWPVVSLDQVAKIERNTILPTAIDGLAYLGLENIAPGGRITNYSSVSVGDLASNKFRFTERHVLYGKLRPYLAKIARPQIEGICSTDILPILPGPKVDRDYLTHCLRQPQMVEIANARATGTSLPRLSPTALAQFNLPLPPLPEQRRIAEVLDRAEALRAKRREAIARLDQLTQSIFLDMFGDPKVNPCRWPQIRFADVIEDGPQNGLYKPSSDYGTGTCILRIDGFYDGVVTGLDSLKRVSVSEFERELYGLNENDVVINRVNSIEYLGKSALIPALTEPVVFESNMMRLRVSLTAIAPRYLIELLQSRFVKLQILTAAKRAVNQASINQHDVKGLLLNLPPLALQQEFARRVGVVERVKASQRAHLAELDSLFTSLQDRAFSGRL